MWQIFYSLYTLLSFYINFNFEYSNGFELLVGTLITAIVLCVIDALIYRCAFNLTGTIRAIIDSDKNEMRLIHWFIRSLLFLIVFMISLTPLPSYFLSPIIHSAYNYLTNWFTLKIQSISDAIIGNLIK